MKDPLSVSTEWRTIFEAESTSPSAPPHVQPRTSASIAAGTPLKGPALALARNMTASLEVPTATSVRTVEAALLVQNRAALNMSRTSGGHSKLTLGQIVAWAIVRAAHMTKFVRVFDANTVEAFEEFGLGVAVATKASLVVPCLKTSPTQTFVEFLGTYDDVVTRAQQGKLKADDFQGVHLSITNPGGFGTSMSVPRLMRGQAAIIGVGSIALPSGFRNTPQDELERLQVAQILTLTSTYDHRVTQGADSGVFLATLDELLQGQHGFYSSMALDATDEEQAPPVVLPSSQSTQAPTPQPTAFMPQLPNALAVQALKDAWDRHGHTQARLDPLAAPSPNPALLPAAFDLDDTDPDVLSILESLSKTFSRPLAAQFSHLSDDKRAFVASAFRDVATPSQEVLRRAAHETLAAETFERFLATKFTGQKRFGLEGAETLLALLSALIELSATRCFIGMPHRGRLNVLAHICQKPYESILSEFTHTETVSPELGRGDVKYHLGYSGVLHDCEVTLAANPSHLEAVTPVVLGMARAFKDATTSDALAIVLHGDAAFAAQGVVPESLLLSGLAAYSSLGAIHVVVDNQVGFTTSPHQARHTTYSTDVALGFDVPVLHANADDLVSVLQAATVAVLYRERFASDVVVRLSGYRRNGHNEGDDASFTQPVMSAAIKSHPPIGEILKSQGLTQDAAPTLELLSKALEAARLNPDLEPRVQPLAPSSAKYVAPECAELAAVLDALELIPDSFSLHLKLQKLFAQRRDLFEAGVVDWAAAELLAFGVLAASGTHVRLVGQDAERGTFSHRHAALFEASSGTRLSPLESFGSFEVHNSPLSEYAALAFEYGYSLLRENSLVLWEAQFGDFANGAQVVIDQFLAAAEDKWGQHSGLTLMLPHGFEGQGPEHSSARLERFLQLSAEGNITVAVPTTSAQWFHLLLRQAHARPARPLVVMTPKAPLRMAEVRSSVEDLTLGSFQAVLDDPSRPASPRRVLLCSGKVFHDLRARRDATHEDVAILRVEQLSPFPAAELEHLLDSYSAPELVWVQEEPENAGAADFVRTTWREVSVVARLRRGSPATGNKAAHDTELESLLQRAFR